MNKIIEMHEMSTGISGMAGEGGLRIAATQQEYYKNPTAYDSWAPSGSSASVATPMNSTITAPVIAQNSYVGSGLNAVDAVSGGKNLLTIGKAENLGGTLNTKQFSDWYANKDNSAMFDALSETEQAAVSSNMLENTIETGAGNDWLDPKGAGGMALGVGQFGLGLANYLDTRKTAKLQRGLMQQQLASNEETMANKREDRAHLKNVFGGGTATSGLKAV